ncbi:hypothetical protein LJC47_03845, partial [Desulfosarcina sp. OttesenSCG-928-B08]|nr:hypothetical protein [Desulfosarcina sp. OttesenSCG-928-B08]
YAVNYKTGEAVIDFHPEYDKDNNLLPMNKKDRSVVIGTSIPSSPVISILSGKSVLFVGVAGGVITQEPFEKRALSQFYWRHVID